MGVKTSTWLLFVCGCGLALLHRGNSAYGQHSPSPTVQPSRPYDGIQAGLDAFRLAEEQRQAAIQTQLGWNQLYRGRAIAPPVRVATVGGDHAWPPLVAQHGRAFAYAYGVTEAVDWNGRGRVRRVSVFEPWPVVPGDIYGVVIQPPLRRPAGQWQGQTGSNRWESHPVYDPPLPEYRPLPEVDSPLLDGTPFANTPLVETPFAGPRMKRPRER